MSDLEDKEKEWAEKVIEDNEEGLERLASEESAKEKRQHRLIQKARNIYRKLLDKEKKASRVEF
ncbi:MAG: hypothetical protein H8Z69_00920 [Nanohaloarchaea archaeon]|nr:hypothetical protein [Candidatus Nanohaloarchaea archaeon]